MNLPGWVGRPQVHAAGCLLALMAALAVVAFTIGTLEYTKTRGKLLLTALLVAGYFVTMLTATAIPQGGAGRWLRASAMGAASVAVLLMVLGLWGTSDSDAFWKATAVVTVVTMGAVAVGIALPWGRPRGLSGALRMLAAGTSSVLALMGVVAIVIEFRVPVYWWAFGLLALCWVASVLGILGIELWRRRTQRP